MKILKLPPYYSPEQVASSHLTNDVNEAFVQAGFTIENYVPSPSRGVSKEVRKQYKKIRYEENANGKIIVHRFPVFAERKNTLLRAFRYLLVNLKQYRRGVKAKNVDVIYAGSTPPTQGVLCAKVKKKLSKKVGKTVPFVYVLQDIFPDSLVSAKMTKKGSLLWKIGRKIEDYTYRNADVIVTLSEDFRRNIMEKGVPEDKIVIIPNWVNTENVFPVSRSENKLFQNLKLDPSLFYVCYSGNIGHSQNMELLLDVAESIYPRMPNVRFVLIGEGAAKEAIAETIQEKQIKNVQLFPFQDYSIIEQVFSLGDVGLIISKAGVGTSSVPSKTWSIMAAERPILASFDGQSELAKIIASTKCGVVAEAGSKEELISGIQYLYEEKEERLKMGARGKAYLEEHLSKEKCIQAYVDVVNSVITE